MAGVFYVTIEGSKQGRFKGESVREKMKDKLEALTFAYEVTSPRDAATGQASGKRRHSPITFTKQWGAASPQLFQAAVTNELLKSVLFEFLRTDQNGQEQVFQTVKLTSATISDLKRTLDEHTPEGARGIDQVALVFQKIEITDTAAKTSASDGPTR